MKTIEERATEFAKTITKTSGLHGHELETQTELIKQCYLAGAEDSQKWYTFDEEVPEKETRVNTIDIHGDICSFAFRSGDIKLSARMLGFVKWKPINLL